MFTKKTLTFLRSLKRHNDRAWFHEHRAEYEQHVRGPMIAVIERLSRDLGPDAPALMIDPKRSLFRPWRDTRFSENKAPLKTNVAATFPNRTLGRMNGAGLYFEVAPGWVWIGGGIYAPDAPQLQAIREHIAGHQRRFEKLITAPAFLGLGGLQGDRLTRVPRGWPKDHPAAEYLMHRQFLGFREEPAAFAIRQDFYRELLSTLRTMVPLVTFLNEPLLARQAPGAAPARQRSRSAR
jgi:uncharacterized protein (TIGR02453 family)